MLPNAIVSGRRWKLGRPGPRPTPIVLRVAAALSLGALFPAGAAAAFAPVDQPGVPLSEPPERLAAALGCSANVDGAARTPVLLVHGTSLTPEENWSASYQPALNSLGIPWCAVALPARGTGDVQSNAEYVVYAIREMSRRAGRRIAVIGASQGGMLPRWALRFWPDTRAMVDDLVALAPSNHGTTQGAGACRRACFPAFRQQSDQSNFIRALNSFQETFAGISYTNVYTRYDEVVRPPQSSELSTGDGSITNVAVQDVCGVDLSDHITLAFANATGFALSLDALAGDGPASRERVGARGCAQPRIPGHNPARLAATIGSYLRNREEGGAAVREEPPLRCYVTGACPGGSTALVRLRLAVTPRRATSSRPVVLRVKARARIGGQLRAVRGAVVRAAGRRARTDRRGRASIRVRFRRPGRRHVTARAPGFTRARATVRVRRPR